MSDTVLVQIWHKEKLWDEAEIDLNGNVLNWMDDALDAFQDAVSALEPGEQFTLIANRL